MEGQRWTARSLLQFMSHPLKFVSLMWPNSLYHTCVSLVLCLFLACTLVWESDKTISIQLSHYVCGFGSLGSHRTSQQQWDVRSDYSLHFLLDNKSLKLFEYSWMSLSRTRLSRSPRYLELKPIPLAHVFQSFTIGYLEFLAISNCFLFPLSVRDCGIQLYTLLLQSDA